MNTLIWLYVVPLLFCWLLVFAAVVFVPKHDLEEMAQSGGVGTYLFLSILPVANVFLSLLIVAGFIRMLLGKEL